MLARVHLETTVVSYLTARRSRDVVAAARQRVTREWWHTRRARFDVYVSQAVLEEARSGDLAAAGERLRTLSGVPLLTVTSDVASLAERILTGVPLPARAAIDALHVALAAAHAMDYLLTWNCRHLANAALRTRIEDVCRRSGYEPPVICTPEELMGEG